MTKFSLLDRKYDRFTTENKNACDFVYNKIKEVKDLFEFVSENPKQFVGTLEQLKETSDIIRTSITDADIASIKKIISRRHICEFTSGYNVLYAIRHTKLNIYGNIVLGDASKSTIDNDININSTSDGFNIERHVELSLFAKDFFMLGMCVNVSTLLIRAISKYMVTDEKILEDIGHLIQVTFVKKWMKYIESIFAITSNIKHYAPTVIRDYIQNGEKDNVRLVDFIKALFIFKVYYNIVNQIEGTVYSQDPEKLMDLIDNMCMYYSVIDGVERATNVLYGVMVNSRIDLKRDIDRVIDDAIDMYRTAIRQTIPGEFRGEPQRLSEMSRDGIKNFTINKKYIMCVEAVFDTAPEMASELSDMNEALESNYNLPSMSSVIGFETLDDISSYSAINAGTRAKILSKFSSKDRKTYIKYENDVLRVTAKANNCNSTFSQSSILNDIEHISTCINVDCDRSDDENFRLLMQLLDSELRQCAQKVVGRNFDKERKTMLYGNLKTLNNYGY